MRIWGKPVEYKGIKIYPMRMKDCTAFYDNVSCLMYEKNKSQDVRVIKMDYLKFLFILMQEDGDIFKRLYGILKLSLQEQIFEFKYSDDGLVFLCVDNVIFSGFDFENIKKIILEENDIKTDEEFLDPALEEALKSAEEYLSKQSGTPPTIEERIIAYHCLTGLDYTKISEITIYQFNHALQRFALIKNFDTYSALLTEHGASKDVQHWLSHIEEKGKYADATMSKEEFNKVSNMLTGKTN